MVSLGTEVRNGNPVALSPEGRRQGTYVLGINGTGKSNLLLDIALQDIEAGDGLCLMDPHGDLIDAVLQRVPRHRVDDVVLFDPSDIDFPFGLNMFECPDVTNPRLVDRVCSEVVLTFKKLFEDFWGPRMEDLIRHTVLTLMGTPECTMLDMLPLLTDGDRRVEYVSRTTDPVLRHYWEQAFPDNKKTQGEWVSSTLNKIGRFLTNPVIRNIVAQPRSSFDFRHIMDSGKVLLVNLSKGKLGEDNASLLGSVLVGKILIAAMSLVATFLGGQTLKAKTTHEWLDVAAVLPLVAFAVGIYVTIRVLQPTTKDPDASKPPEERAGLQLTGGTRRLHT